MLQTIEGMIDNKGRLRLLIPTKLPPLRRVLITILDEEPDFSVRESAMLSEAALAEEWLTPEEDEAWSHLSQLPSL
ncbi:MAG: hypothetical protein KBG20_14910 [Caldilineaceae bacterium]|nr:hypothetical protein [Caldilineaceae bacterium]MBP8110595.1 hypothetical protein [Caldilineaceae bacterium]MBP8125755.1 hypothetical protein [Caldilineaceae bacterium]MBP9073595.1 hypothetical protein [Caldilineaceae bacterium]